MARTGGHGGPPLQEFSRVLSVPWSPLCFLSGLRGSKEGSSFLSFVPLCLCVRIRGIFTRSREGAKKKGKFSHGATEAREKKEPRNTRNTRNTRKESRIFVGADPCVRPHVLFAPFASSRGHPGRFHAKVRRCEEEGEFSHGGTEAREKKEPRNTPNTRK